MTWSSIALLAILGLFAVPAVAGDDQPAGREEAMAAGEEKQGPQTREEAAEARPERRGGGLTYRERINMITRKPLRKDRAEAPRDQAERYWRGVRDARPIIARKRTGPPDEDRTRWEHVQEVARGPIRMPRKK
jgi:hypothetical protein